MHSDLQLLDFSALNLRKNGKKCTLFDILVSAESLFWAKSVKNVPGTPYFLQPIGNGALGGTPPGLANIVLFRMCLPPPRGGGISQNSQKYYCISAMVFYWTICRTYPSYWANGQKCQKWHIFYVIFAIFAICPKLHIFVNMGSSYKVLTFILRIHRTSRVDSRQQNFVAGNFVSGVKNFACKENFDKTLEKNFWTVKIFR